MKKWHKAVAIMLGATMCIPSLTGCGGSGASGGNTELKAPVLTLNGNYVYWSIIDDADGYGVYISDERITTVTSVRYSLASLPAGSYKVEVAAVYGDKESEKSNAVTYVKEQGGTADAPEFVYSELDNGKYEYSGLWQQVTDTVVTRQLKDRQLWADFVNQFRSNVDGEGGGWRGEFWGKLMMGACLTYEQTADAELYGILETTVKDILTTQSADGRISSYGRLENDEPEFCYWDMWCRKYVIMGMEYFYGICKDETLKQTLVNSMLAQLDYIMKYVGDGDDKLNINETGSSFAGLASSSMLEGIVKLYEISGEKRVLDFAKHIIDNGGCGNHDLIDAAVKNTSLPYTWGAPKAYELTSLFDGVLDYYMATGEERYRTAGLNYAYAIMNSEITVTGGGGYNSEEFNYSAREQANPTNSKANLETCVTTSLIRIFYKAYMLTGDLAFIDTMEKTLYNQLIGAVDTEGNFDHAFTSYFNLVFATKIRASGGGMQLAERPYGCCIAYGAAGTGMIHKAAQTATDTGFNVNFYLNGKVTATSPSGGAVSLATQTNYPNSGTVKITIGTDAPQTFDVNLRIPSWSERTAVSVNGKSISGATAGKYFTLAREWKNGDSVAVTFDMQATLFYGSADCSDPDAQYNVAVLRGPIALARDKRLDGDIFQTVDIPTDENGRVNLVPSNTAGFDNICEFALTLKDGKVIHLVDYASAGKTYDERSFMTVFMPTTDYWKGDYDLQRGAVLVCSHKELIATVKDGELMYGEDYDDCADPSAHKLRFVERGDGYYSIHFGDSQAAITAGADSHLTEQAYTGSDRQLFRLERLSLSYYRIICKADNRLLSGGGPNGSIWLYNNVDSVQQKWKFVRA